MVKIEAPRANGPRNLTMKLYNIPDSTAEIPPKSCSAGRRGINLPKPVKIILIVLVVFIILIGGLSFAAYSYAKTFVSPVEKAQTSITNVVSSLQNRDLISAKSESQNLKQAVEEIDQKYQKADSISKLPLLGSYLQDGRSIINAAKSANKVIDGLINAIEPYSDLVGFKTDTTTANIGQSAEDKIIFLAETLNKIAPQLDTISADLNQAKAEIDKINPNRYPVTLLNKQVRSKIVTLKSSVDESANLVSQSKPLIKLLPDLLGNPNSKLYLLLFQNDAELRPTGGFITAYAYIKVTKGKIEPLGSYDIYDLDSRFNKNIPAPEPIKKYLEETRWNLRNMNISPDFKTSMTTFTDALKSINGLPQYDGIIALDTNVPVELLKVLGPIGVGGWGNFSAQNDPRCDCPQVVYALEEIADKPVSGTRVGRKAVLGPLMHSILANAMGSPKHMWPKFFNLAIDAIKQKHLLFYFKEDITQKAAEDFNAAGRITSVPYDYLHINDSNFGGAKTDMFITREVEQEIESTNGKTAKTVTITYNNPHKGSNCNLEAGQLCLNGKYRDWVRVYVPKGSKLISVTGSELKEVVSEDLDKTVFEAFFTMRPESSSKLVFKYELPELTLTPYRLLIQKQPGLPSIKHTILFNGKPTTIDLNSDTDLTLE
jgi:hypothetical protein